MTDAAERDVNGVRMPAKVIIGLEQRDPMPARKQPGTGNTGDAAADNGAMC